LHPSERRDVRAIRPKQRRTNICKTPGLELCCVHLVRYRAPQLSGTMTAEPTDRTEELPVLESGAESGLTHQLGMMIRALFGTPVYKTLVLLAASIVIVVVVTAYGQVRLNGWNKPFFDALSRRDLHDFFVQLGVFFIIVACLLVLNVAQRWLVETLKYKLRE